MANNLCHLEISAKDAKKASEFYKNLFGWKIDTEMGDDYIFFQPESGPGGGIMKNDNFTPGDSVVAYVEVEDIEASLAKAVGLGGKQVYPKTEIPGIGWHGRIADLDGNLMGLFTAKK